MADPGNHTPKPDSHWIALGVVVFALAASMGPNRRRAFIEALEQFTAETEARSRIVAFGRVHSGAMSRNARTAASWLRRVVSQLRAAFE
jgi:hypothetical protein